MGPTLSSFVSYIHYLRELHTFCQKSLGLNNVTYVFHNLIQVVPLGREIVNICLQEREAKSMPKIQLYSRRK